MPDRRNDLWMPQLERFAALVRAKALADQFRDATKMVAEPVNQEPVAWMFVNDDGECEEIGYGADYLKGSELMSEFQPLYASPVDAKAIRAKTLEEAAKFADNFIGKIEGYTFGIGEAIRGLK